MSHKVDIAMNGKNRCAMITFALNGKRKNDYDIRRNNTIHK